MKNLSLVLLAVVVAFADARYTTYEPVVEQLYFLGNDIRKDPSIIADTLSGDAADYVNSRGKAKNLEWSDGLARGCRDLVLDNGPYGIEGHSTSRGKDQFDRAAIYTSYAGGLQEVVVYDQIDDIAADDREAMQVYKNMMNNAKEREALFNADFTHVGISCGCHATKEEMCCFAYGKDVIDKRGI